MYHVLRGRVLTSESAISSTWKESTWGKEVSINYGKSLRDYDTNTGDFQVFGTNGPIGWCDHFLVDGPGIILGRKGATRGVFFSERPFYVIDTAYYVTPNSKMNLRWLYFAIIYHRLAKIDDGSPIPSTPRSAIRNIPLLVPPVETQEKIGNCLTNYDHLSLSNQNIANITQKIISTLFRSWFIDFEPVKAKEDGKLSYGMDEEIAALFPDSFVDSELGPIPAGWTIGTIHDIAKQRKDIARPEVFNEMLPYIGLEHMPRNSIALTEWGVSEGLESNKFGFSKKDILFGKLRPYFHKVGPAPLEGVCSTDILVIQPIDEKLGGFLLPILSSEHFVNFVSGISEGVGLPRTKWEHFKLYKIALPPVEIRDKFVSLVDPMLQIIESFIHESKGLEHARDALLPRLMSGELSVS